MLAVVVVGVVGVALKDQIWYHHLPSTPPTQPLNWDASLASFFLQSSLLSPFLLLHSPSSFVPFPPTFALFSFFLLPFFLFLLGPPLCFLAPQILLILPSTLLLLQS